MIKITGRKNPNEVKSTTAKTSNTSGRGGIKIVSAPTGKTRNSDQIGRAHV